jgi:hypothetical protein
MNAMRALPVVLCLIVAGVLLVGCGNKGPLVQAAPVPPIIDGTPTMAAEEDTDPSDEVSPPEDGAPDSSTPDSSTHPATPEPDAAEAPLPETEPTPEPTPEPVPPDATPNG